MLTNLHSLSNIQIKEKDFSQGTMNIIDDRLGFCQIERHQIGSKARHGILQALQLFVLLIKNSLETKTIRKSRKQRSKSKLPG